MIDLFFLKTFVAITKTDSFRIAAERNHITQPAVSQHVRILEKKLGSALFKRHGKKVSLTAAGKTFLPYAENILKQYEESKIRVREIDGEFSGTIRIATIYSIGLYNLKCVIRKFVKKYPKIHLHLEYHQSTVIYEMIINRTIDFGLVAYPQEKPGIIPDIFLEDTLVFVQSPHHRAFGKKRISLKEVDAVKFIAFSPTTSTGKIIHQLFAAKNVHPKIIQEYDNVELIKNAVLLGLGCAFLPKSTIIRELEERSVEVVNIAGVRLKRPLGIIYPEKQNFTKSSRAFHETLMGKNYCFQEPALRI